MSYFDGIADAIYIRCPLKKAIGEELVTWQVSHCPMWALEELRHRIDLELQDRKRIEMIVREGMHGSRIP